MQLALGPWPVILACALVPLAAAAGCWRMQDQPVQDGGADSDSDSDSDSDADSDSDSDSDTDTGPVDCEDLPEYCCSPDCPCEDDAYECVPTHWSGEDGAGVCHIPAPQGECWTTAECDVDEFCAGAFVCGCWVDCDWEGTGTCAPAATNCCDDNDDCEQNYVCKDLGDDPDTCHGQLEFPACWDDEDCSGGNCVDAWTCPCDAYCVGQPGTCDNWG